MMRIFQLKLDNLWDGDMTAVMTQCFWWLAV